MRLFAEIATSESFTFSGASMFPDRLRDYVYGIVPLGISCAVC